MKLKFKLEKNILDFSLYVSFFPKLIMGPIIRYQDFKKQLVFHGLKKNNLEKGFASFLMGCVQKVCIANQLGTIWNMAQGSESACLAWLGIYNL